MNPKTANIQLLQRLDQLEHQLTQAGEGQYLTIDDIRNTIHQVADIVVELSKTIPAILAELKTLAELIAKMTSEANHADPHLGTVAKAEWMTADEPPAIARKMSSSKAMAKK